MPQPLDRDLDATRASLLVWFAGRIPEGADFAIDALRGPSATGFSSDTLMFDLHYRQGQGQGQGQGQDEDEDEGDVRRSQALVARIEPASAFPVFPSYDVALQFEAMSAMREKGVPVPTMRWLEESPEILGSRFYVMDSVEGVVPTDTPPYHQAGWVSELAPEDRTRLWWNGLAAMCQVHRVDLQDPLFGFLPRPPAGRTPIEAQLDYYEGFLDWGCDRSRLPLVLDSLTWLRANAPRDEPLGICWGDSRLGNQIFRDLECIAVIDWEMVFVGNPVADLAWWTTVDRCFTDGIGIPRSEGFPGVAETVARWEEQVGRKAEHFSYYEIFAAFRFSIVMARIAGQLKYYELIPADHEMDVSNLASFTLERLLEEAGAR